MIKRYNLSIPKDLYDEVQSMADEEETTVLEIFKRLMKIGFVLYKKQREPDIHFIIRENGKDDKEVIFT